MLELALENLGQAVGREVGVSDWMLVDQERIELFAGAVR